MKDFSEGKGVINFIFYSSSASAIDQLLAEGESESNQSQKNSDMLTATFNAEIEGIVTSKSQRPHSPSSDSFSCSCGWWNLCDLQMTMISKEAHKPEKDAVRCSVVQFSAVQCLAQFSSVAE